MQMRSGIPSSLGCLPERFQLTDFNKEVDIEGKRKTEQNKIKQNRDPI